MRHLRNTYGITLAEYDALGSSCQICGVKHGRMQKGKPDSLVVDHCHDTGNVCGVLCHKCNTGIGHFYHDVALMQKAIDYVARTRPHIT
jgi:recombination endonuclease VII